VAEDLKQYAVPLNGLERFARLRRAWRCIGRSGGGIGRAVLAAAGIAQWF